MDKPLSLTEKEAKIIELIRKLQYGQIVINVQDHMVIHVERKESIKI